MPIFKFQQSTNKLNPLISVVVLLAIMIGFFFAAQYIYKLLLYISPVVILITLILDYRVFASFGKLLMAFTKQNLIAGICFIALSVFLFPLIALFLLGKALLKRRISKFEQSIYEQENTFFSFEEVEEPVINVAKKDAEKKYNYGKLFEDA